MAKSTEGNQLKGIKIDNTFNLQLKSFKYNLKNPLIKPNQIRIITGHYRLPPNHSILVLSAADAVRVGLSPSTAAPHEMPGHDVHFYDTARSKLFKMSFKNKGK